MVYFALKILWHEGVLVKVLLGSLMVIPFHLFDWHYYGAYFFMLLLAGEFVSAILPREHMVHLVKIYGYRTSFLVASNCTLMVLLHAANLLSLMATCIDFRNGMEISQPLIFSCLVFLALLAGNLYFYYVVVNQQIDFALKPVLVMLYFVTVSIAFFTLWILASPNVYVLLLVTGALGFVWLCSLYLVSYGEN